MVDTDATRAIAAFIQAMEEAQTMGKAGNVGHALDDVLVHARELLDIVDEELLRLDRKKHRHVFEAASTPAREAGASARRAAWRCGPLSPTGRGAKRGPADRASHGRGPDDLYFRNFRKRFSEARADDLPILDNDRSQLRSF